MWPKSSLRRSRAALVPCLWPQLSSKRQRVRRASIVVTSSRWWKAGQCDERVRSFRFWLPSGGGIFKSPELVHGSRFDRLRTLDKHGAHFGRQRASRERSTHDPRSNETARQVSDSRWWRWTETSQRNVRSLRLSTDESVDQLWIDARATSLQETCLKAPICMATKYRSFDGSCNNLRHPNWGRALTPQERLLPPQYTDG